MRLPLASKLKPFRDFESSDYFEDLIPGGAHTYSRGRDQFPSNAPRTLAKGKGYRVWDERGNEFLDLSMGLRSVSLGHGMVGQSAAILKASLRGLNLSRPTLEEYALAERLRELIPAAEMVKFGKNGSDANNGAIRLSRAATGKDYILRCSDTSFLSVADWFVGSTPMSSGTLASTASFTKTFPYGDMSTLKGQFDSVSGNVAAVILEPYGREGMSAEFLHSVREFCRKERVVMVLDEIVSGFRWNRGGLHQLAGVVPDLVTFGKGIANGFPLSVLAGSRDLMELGGLRHSQDRVFLMSSTFGPERVSIAAADWTLQKLQAETIAQNLQVAKDFTEELNSAFTENGLKGEVCLTGPNLLPYLSFTGRFEADIARARAALGYAAIQHGVLMPYFSFSASHRKRFLERFSDVASDIVSSFVSIWDSSQNVGSIEPVFRSRNL